MFPFYFTLPIPSQSFKVGSVNLLCEKIKQYLVLYDKKMKGYRELDVMRNAWNAWAKDVEFIKNEE